MIRAAACVLAVLAAAAVQPVPARAAAPLPLTVWVSPAGSDSNDGTSPAAPFATLQHASDWLCGSPVTCTGRGQPVDVRIAQTLIRVTSTTTWRYYDAAYPTILEPWSYQPGQGWAQVASAGGYPTFDGGFTVDTGLVFAPAGAGAAPTRVTFTYLRWQHFNIAGIFLSGGLGQTVNSNGITVTSELPDAANGVSLYGDYFYQIGNYWNPARHMGFGAVEWANSSGDTIRNSHFVQLMNTAADAGHVHGLYIAHGSAGTIVSGNEFTDITGDAVRQRDLSDGTLVTGNRFTRAGQYAYADDWYCSPAKPDSYCFPKEYRSWGGRFHGNILNGLFPEGITGRRTAYCFDQPAGACPAARWNTAP